MSKYIDAEKPFRVISRLMCGIPMFLLDEYEKNGIDIVFCKECKWLRYCETEDLDLYLDCDKPDGGGIPRGEDWFCADGEREGE